MCSFALVWLWQTLFLPRPICCVMYGTYRTPTEAIGNLSHQQQTTALRKSHQLTSLNTITKTHTHTQIQAQRQSDPSIPLASFHNVSSLLCGPQQKKRYRYYSHTHASSDVKPLLLLHQYNPSSITHSHSYITHIHIKTDTWTSATCFPLRKSWKGKGKGL